MTNKKKLNNIRYHMFLDPAGTNRKYFEEIMQQLTKSLLDWYLPGDPRPKSESFQDIFSAHKKSPEEIEEHFRKRDSMIKKCKQAVPDTLSPEKTRERYDKEQDRRFPEKSKTLDQVLDELNENTDPSIRFNQNFNGEMHPHDSIIAYATSMISKFLNANVIAQCVSPSISPMERVATRWLADLIGYQSDTSDDMVPQGNIVGGGTMANLTALLVARNKTLKEKTGKTYKGVSEKGIQEFCQDKMQGAVILTSEQAHYSIKKLGGYIGIGNDNVLEVPIDREGRMRPEALEDMIQKAKSQGKKVLAVIATAGTTYCGAVDPVDKIADITEREGIYLHVDAAHGGAFLTSRAKNLFKGIERSDSVTIDGHKMFYTNYSCGGIIFKKKDDPVNHLKQSAAYILGKTEHYDNGKSTVEGSRGADGILQLYGSIRMLGKEGYETLLNHTLDMIKHLYEKVKGSDMLEALHEPQLNVFCFRYAPKTWDKEQRSADIDSLNKRLNQAIYEDGEFYIGSTTLNLDGKEKTCQRAIIVHPYIEQETIDQMVEKIELIGKRLSEDGC